MFKYRSVVYSGKLIVGVFLGTTIILSGLGHISRKIAMEKIRKSNELKKINEESLSTIEDCCITTDDNESSNSTLICFIDTSKLADTLSVN